MTPTAQKIAEELRSNLDPSDLRSLATNLFNQECRKDAAVNKASDRPITTAAEQTGESIQEKLSLHNIDAAM